MRFLMFNIMAACAIAYLVWGESDNPLAVFNQQAAESKIEAMSEIQAPQQGAAPVTDSAEFGALQDTIVSLKDELQELRALPETVKTLQQENAALQTKIADLQSVAKVQPVSAPPESPQEAPQESIDQQLADPRPEQLARLAGSTEPVIESEPMDNAAMDNAIQENTPPAEDGKTDTSTDLATDLAPVANLNEPSDSAPDFLTPKERRRELQILSQGLEEIYMRSLGEAL